MELELGVGVLGKGFEKGFFSNPNVLFCCSPPPPNLGMKQPLFFFLFLWGVVLGGNQNLERWKKGEVGKGYVFPLGLQPPPSLDVSNKEWGRKDAHPFEAGFEGMV